jgi:hypothetical protein
MTWGTIQATKRVRSRARREATLANQTHHEESRNQGQVRSASDVHQTGKRKERKLRIEQAERSTPQRRRTGWVCCGGRHISISGSGDQRGEEKEWNGHSVRAGSCRRTEPDEGTKSTESPERVSAVRRGGRPTGRANKKVTRNERKRGAREITWIWMNPRSAECRGQRRAVGGKKTRPPGPRRGGGSRTKKKSGRSLELVGGTDEVAAVLYDLFFSHQIA